MLKLIFFKKNQQNSSILCFYFVNQITKISIIVNNYISNYMYNAIFIYISVLNLFFYVRYYFILKLIL